MMSEAVATIQRLHAREIKPNVYMFSNGYIVISGMGNLAAASFIALHGSNAKEIWNLGAAGCLTGTSKPLEIFEISTVINNPLLPDIIDVHSQKLYESLHPPIILSPQGKRLVSSHYPIHLPELREKLAQYADLIDMEGYGVAHAAEHLGVPCRQWKVVTDFCNAQGPDMIEKLLNDVSKICADTVENRLNSDR